MEENKYIYTLKICSYCRQMKYVKFWTKCDCSKHGYFEVIENEPEWTEHDEKDLRSGCGYE